MKTMRSTRTSDIRSAGSTHPRYRLRGALQGLVLLLASSSAFADTPRVITLGGDITEIVYALGAGGTVVAADTSSVYPPEAAALTKIGYQRQVAAEGLLALNPTLIIASDDAGPPAALTQLRDAKVRVEVIAADDTPEGAAGKVRGVAKVLGREKEGERVVADLTAALAAAERERAGASSAPRVLFVYARGAGTVQVAGRGTSADAMIRLAGGRNAVEEFEGFKPLTAEAAVAASPDVILMLARGMESLGGADAVWAQPGLAQTPAASGKRLVVMDDLYLLGFGPRTGAAVADLARQLHPELATAK